LEVTDSDKHSSFIILAMKKFYSAGRRVKRREERIKKKFLKNEEILLK
jgi:hypothetical protein